MLLCMTDLLGLILSTILVLLIELIESALEHLVGILRYINVYVLLLSTLCCKTRPINTQNNSSEKFTRPLNRQKSYLPI